MKRLLFWYLPLALAAAAAATFLYGFTLGIRGGAGARVTDDLRAAPRSAPAPAAAMRIVVLGDSLARGTGDERGLGIDGRLAAELRQRRIPLQPPVNLAINGARTDDLLRQLESANVRALVAEASAIVISIGGNDLNVYRVTGSRERPEDFSAILDEVLGRVENVVREIRKVNPKGRIFLLGIYNPFVQSPWGAMLTAQVNRWNARLGERFSDDANLTVVQIADLFSHRDRLSVDRFHPGGEGYALIGRRIAEGL